MQMTGDAFIDMLGSTADDVNVKTFLTQCGIQKRPKIPSDEEDVNLTCKDLGLEITFTDERALDVQTRDYEEGSVVLSSVMMYGPGHKKYKPFAGTLPAGLHFDMTPEQAYAELKKKPAAQNSKRTLARWDFKGYCIFITTDADRKLVTTVSVQLPVK